MEREKEALNNTDPERVYELTVDASRYVYIDIAIYRYRYRYLFIHSFIYIYMERETRSIRTQSASTN